MRDLYGRICMGEIGERFVWEICMRELGESIVWELLPLVGFLMIYALLSTHAFDGAPLPRYFWRWILFTI